MELLTLCRSCMVEVASWELQKFDDDAVKMFTFCTNVEISEDDKLPKQFCCDCRIKIESSYTFIKKAQEVNLTLHNIVSCAETNGMVKTENLINELQNHESNSLKSDSGFSFEDKMDENEEKNISTDSHQTIEYKMVFDTYQNSAENSENEQEESDVKLNSDIDDFDKHSERISNDIDPKNKQKTSASKKDSKCRNKKNQAKKRQKEIPDLETCNTRSKKHKSYEHKSSEEKVKVKADDGKKFQCDICKLCYKSKTGVQRHIMNRHASDNTYLKTCNICGRKFTSSCLSTHVEKEHKKQYSCPHCPKTYNNIGSYRNHKAKHVESFKFACGECDARFRLGTQLAKHALAQAHARPHVCTKCGMAFKTKIILNDHIKSHLDERLYLCSICGYSSNREHVLDIHMTTHTGKKKFSCNECSFRSATSGSLRVHERRHRGERRCPCPHCGKRFYDPAGLRRHERRMHTGARPFHCYLCSEAFADGWNCKQHIMRDHHIPLQDIPRLSKKTPPHDKKKQVDQ